MEKRFLSLSLCLFTELQDEWHQTNSRQIFVSSKRDVVFTETQTKCNDQLMQSNLDSRFVCSVIEVNFDKREVRQEEMHQECMFVSCLSSASSCHPLVRQSELSSLVLCFLHCIPVDILLEGRIVWCSWFVRQTCIVSEAYVSWRLVYCLISCSILFPEEMFKHFWRGFIDICVHLVLYSLHTSYKNDRFFLLPSPVSFLVSSPPKISYSMTRGRNRARGGKREK